MLFEDKFLVLLKWHYCLPQFVFLKRKLSSSFSSTLHRGSLPLEYLLYEGRTRRNVSSDFMLPFGKKSVLSILRAIYGMCILERRIRETKKGRKEWRTVKWIGCDFISFHNILSLWSVVRPKHTNRTIVSLSPLFCNFSIW